MKLHLRYFLYQQKRIFQYIPQMIAGAIVLAVLAGTIAFCAVSKLSETSETTKVPVALVIESDSKTMQLVLDIISSMESVKQHFNFLEMSEEDALRALDTGDVCAVMMLPKDVLSGIMDGTNYHVPVLLSDSDVLSSILLQELIVSGAKTLSAAQAGTYTMTELYREAGLSYALSDAYMELDIRNLQYALVRDDLFNTRTASPTGNVSTQNYYLSAGILFYLLMSGICCVRFYDRGSAAQLQKLSSARIGVITQGISSYCNVFLAQLISFLPIFLFLTWRLVIKHFTLNAYLTLLLLFLILLLSTSAYLYAVLALSKTPSAGVTLIFSITILLMLASGCFIPTGLLPGALLSLQPFLPTTAMMHQLFHIFSYFNSTSYQYSALFDTTCITLLLYAFCFLLLGILLFRIRRRKQ